MTYKKKKEIYNMINKYKQEYLKIYLKNIFKKNKNTSCVKKEKKKIARIITIINQKI